MDRGVLGMLRSMVLSNHERVLAQSGHFFVTHEWEAVFVIDRRTGARVGLGDHYGDPTCAVIAAEEEWFAAGGEGITILHRGRLHAVGRAERWFVAAMREEPPGSLRVLLDPWGDTPGVVQVDPATGAARWLSTEPDLRDQPWSADVPF